MIREILSFLLLAVFLLINILLTLNRLGTKIFGTATRKTLRIELPENEKKAYEKFFTLLWIIIGIWAFWRIKDMTLIGAILAFLAFRSGGNVSKTLIYGIHDMKIIREYTSDSRILEAAGKVVQLSLLLESLLIFSFALSYKVISAMLNGINLIILLWFGGVIIGALFSLFIAKNNKGILTKDDIIVVLFFMGKKGRDSLVTVAGKTKQRLKP